EMFRRAASFKSLSRERLVSISVAAEVFVRLHPDHFRVEQLIRMSSIWDKTSQERRNTMRTCEMNCMSILSGIVRDGIAQGDFKLPEPMTPEDIVFGLWSLNSGGHMIIDSSASLQEIGVSDPFLALKRHNNALLDGYQWKPLSHEHDFTQVFQETLDHVFPEEKRELETLLQ
ncbi:MAG: hypothetical protein MPJ24_11420, partial [Pirellulaceae bacterium]|nr:hypothetical protein [Pirellulaceae bacterium]